MDEEVGKLSAVFSNEYKKSKIARFDYEVFYGKRSFRGLVELEAALHHVVLSFDDGTMDRLFEIESVKNHLQRIAIDLTEEVAESLCLIIREKLNPFLKHPFLSKVMLVPKPDQIGDHWEELRKYEELIRKGRNLKGEKENFNECYECFKTALEKLWELDARIPASPFWSHLFTVIIAFVCLIIGFLLSFIVK